MNDVVFHVSDPERTWVIEETDNGYIINAFVSYMDSVEYRVKRYLTIIDDCDKKSYAEDIKNFLWNLMDEMEIYFSKHDSHRITIKVESHEK